MFYKTKWLSPICKGTRLHCCNSAFTQVFPQPRFLSSELKESSNYLHPEQDGFYETPFIIFDTAKNQKCRLTSKRRNVLRWYSCGPTVYDSAHIGHACSFIRQDVVRRILESMGDPDLSVIQVMGITDIDDKIIRKANQSGSEWSLVSKQYEKEFKEDLSRLNVIPPHVFTSVSDFIPQILDFVGRLVESSYAYPTRDGSVYFDTEKYGKRYGKFRQAQIEDASSEESEEHDITAFGKKSVRDFALWKGAKPGEPYWKSPWGSGKGRPGWHIECSVMASQIFGPTLDLHTGGKDLIFPHHENEEAQCCAHFNSNQWSCHWLHMGHLHFKGDVKMSKSLGNTLSISEFLSQHPPDLLRMLCINAKYRKDLEYSGDTIDISKKILKKFTTFSNDVDAIIDGSKLVKTAEGQDDTSLWKKLFDSRVQLKEALLNDFDTPEALKILTDFMSEFNKNYVNVNVSHGQKSSVDYELVLASKIFVQDFLTLVGFTGFSRTRTDLASGIHSPSDANYINLINHFVKFRNQVRSFSLAMDETNKTIRKEKITQRKSLLTACDSVRNDLLIENGIEIKDHGEKSSWSFSESQKSLKSK